MCYDEAFLRHGFKRRFFSTARGNLASGPAHLYEDDIICVLLGVKAPVLLKPNEEKDGCDFIGPVYVHGITHGEAMGHEPLGGEKLEIEAYMLVCHFDNGAYGINSFGCALILVSFTDGKSWGTSRR